MFEVSHSKIKTGRRCLNAYHKKYVRKLRKRVKSKSLTVGTLVHSCLESYFRNGYYLPEIQKWKEQEYEKMFVEEQALYADVIPLVKQLIRGYISHWKSLGLEMLWVEKEFRVEIAPGLILVGKIDGRARDNRGMEWLVEHKTAKKMPGEEVRIFDTQVLLYAGVLPHLGEKPVNGVIWDYLRTKLPSKPKLLKNGGLSTAKIDTTKEVYLREIKRHGLDPAGYEDILADLESRKDSFYRQVKLPLSDTMGKTILEELIVTARQLEELEKQDRQEGSTGRLFPRNLTRDCSWCDFAPLCHAELRGEDTEYLLKHDYMERKNDEKELDLETGEASD